MREKGDMAKEMTRADAYLYRAEELRAIASEMKHEEPREMLERVADDYERMADNELIRRR